MANELHDDLYIITCHVYTETNYSPNVIKIFFSKLFINFFLICGLKVYNIFFF